MNRFIEVTLPYTVGFLVATLSCSNGINPYIAFVVGETVALLSRWLVRFLIKVL
jgi:hypothetical protein